MTLQERNEELVQLIIEAVNTGKPVCIGMWGPTKQKIYVTVTDETVTVVSDADNPPAPDGV